MATEAGLLEKVAYKLHLEKFAQLLKRHRIYKLVSKFADSQNFSTLNVSSASEESYHHCELPEKVFTLWLQGTQCMPQLVKVCVESMKRHCPQQEIVVLDRNTIDNWVSLPKELLYKLDKGIISSAHFSDVLRFCLLSQYGGWWLDATIFLSSTIPSVSNLFTIKHSFSRQYVSGNMWKVSYGISLKVTLLRCT